MNSVKILKKYFPNAVTTFRFGCLFTGAELTQQLVIYKIYDFDLGTWRSKRSERCSLDWANIGRYAIWGFAIFPHVLRKWYHILDTTIKGSSWKAACAKTLVDQTIFPLPILASFFIFLSALEGKTRSWSELVEECDVKLKETLKARYCFMIPAQVIHKSSLYANFWVRSN